MTNETEMAMEEKVSKNKSKKEFKQTKELMKIAKDNGWNQIKIAKKCRSHQSIVSDWFKGTKKATEAQLKPLLEEFGYLLRRNTFRLYQNVTEEGKLDYFKVEGRIIFNYVIYDKVTTKINYRDVDKYDEIEKIIVHFQGNSKFILIRQMRMTDDKNQTLMKSHPSYNDTLWRSQISIIEEMDVLIKAVLDCTKDLNKKVEMKFLLIEALLNHGFEVDNIKVYPASW